MAGPARYSTKVRAKRIALQYFRRLHPFRRWKLILSIAAPVLAAVWILIAAGRGDQRIYLGGPVSTAHAMFETECRVCHGPGPTPGAPVTQATLATAAATTPRKFFLTVSDNACTTCHAGPDHNTKSVTPRCASCHVEHLGREVLAQIADRHCVQCHRSLEPTKPQKTDFHRSVTAFDGQQHPQFAVTVKDRGRVLLDATPPPTDDTPIKLNHLVHLKAGLQGIDKFVEQRGPDGVAKVQVQSKSDPAAPPRDALKLTCTACHQPDERGQYMKEIVYEKHCAACHELGFEGLTAPHENPVIVRAFVRGSLADLYDQCRALPANADAAQRTRCSDAGIEGSAPPAARGRRGATAETEAPAADTPRGLRRSGGAAAEDPEPPPSDAPRGLRRGGGAAVETPPSDAPRGLRRGGAAEAEAPADTPRGMRRGGAAPAEAAPAAPKGWVAERTAAAHGLLFGKQVCGSCHTLKGNDPASVEVVPPKIPARWLPHSRFDHAPHRPLACVECHGLATTSEKTTDVLMPKAETCRECHRPRAGARAGCVECHRYHDKTREASQDGPFKVHQLLDRIGPSPADRVR